MFLEVLKIDPARDNSNDSAHTPGGCLASRPSGVSVGHDAPGWMEFLGRKLGSKMMQTCAKLVGDWNMNGYEWIMFPFSWECPSSQLTFTPSFFRGMAQPPTRNNHGHVIKQND